MGSPLHTQPNSAPDHIRLSRPLTRNETLPVWPAGVALALFSATLAPKVHALMQLAYADGGGTVPAAFDAWWAATRHDPEFDAGLCIVAVSGTEPVGFALCWTSSFIKDLVVHPGWRRHGLGTALLREAFVRLAERGNETVSLKAWRTNAAALLLYERLGFREA